MTRALGYVRISKEDERKKNPALSLEQQEAKIRAYCSLKDMDCLEVICDNGISAKNLKRDGMQRVIEMAKRKEFDALVIYQKSRAFREIVDAWTLVRLLQKKGISFHSITDDINTSTAIGRLTFSITVAVDQYEREITGERTKDVLHYLKGNGHKTGGLPPYGWDAEGGKLIPNEVEKNVIENIHTLHEGGASLREICRHLEVNGVKPKAAKRWSPSTVTRILGREGR